MIRVELSLSLVVLALAWHQPLVAQPACDPPENEEILSAYLQRFSDCYEAPFEEAAVAKETKEALAAMPTATPATGGFGSGLRDSIEDFLPLLSFAVDSVSTGDDDKSLAMRLNPLRAGAVGSIGLTVNVTEPEPGESLLNSVPEAQRPALREFATEALEDFADLTFSAKWGFERKASADSRRMWGRTYENYRALIEERLLPAVSAEALGTEEDSAEITDCENRAAEADVEDAQGATIGDLRRALGADFAECLEVWENDEKRVVDADKKLDALALIPHLIDTSPSSSSPSRPTIEIRSSAARAGRRNSRTRKGWRTSIRCFAGTIGRVQSPGQPTGKAARMRGKRHFGNRSRVSIPRPSSPRTR